jgi:hypothetical protein
MLTGISLLQESRWRYPFQWQGSLAFGLGSIVIDRQYVIQYADR